MENIAQAIGNAKEHAANDTQRYMLTEYAKSFCTGSLEAFKQIQCHWVHDKQPAIETNIGFIERYADPHGIRAEWGGLVAIVNKERSKTFSQLVTEAPTFIPKLPWSKDFEKDKFLSPDFTSLEVLTCADGPQFIGQNIPNYDDVRQNEGFKNILLRNVLYAKMHGGKIPFIKDSDLDLYQGNDDIAWEILTNLHELFGHGCGKLLQETSPGQYNFDIKNPPISPLTGEPITTWYKPVQTWGSVFGDISCSYEECRAECIAWSSCVTLAS